MTIPYRGRTTATTYFVTAGTYLKENVLQSEAMAELFCQVLFRYRAAQKLQLHAFVVMPNHFHLLLTVPEGSTVERVMQLIKGGFSYDAGRLLGARFEIWQKSFVDRRIRDAGECGKYRDYIHENPVRAGLAGSANEYRYSSLNPAFTLDELPQRLEAVPLQACRPQPPNHVNDPDWNCVSERRSSTGLPWRLVQATPSSADGP